MINVAAGILLLVFLAVALRQTLGLKLPIWQVMTLGALADLLTGQISWSDALRSIDPDVMMFLFGMFVVGAALDASGYLSHLAFMAFSPARTTDQLVILILLVSGGASALLMNDTLAIAGTPVMVALARQHGLPPRLLLLALAFAITTGSVMSPIGNPQNMLIAVEGSMREPFLLFVKHLGIPTVLSLAVVYGVLRLMYRREFHRIPLSHVKDPVTDPRLAALCRFSLWILLGLVGIKILTVSLEMDAGLRLSFIVLGSACPLLAASPRRMELIRKVDWPTLVFFASLFIVMQSVWNSGVLQVHLAGSGFDLSDTGFILGSGILASQILSNVPWVALYLPVLSAMDAGPHALLALAAGSTLAGNLLVLGAASNIIILENAERRFGESLSFWEFARVGAPLTLAQGILFWTFL